MNTDDNATFELLDTAAGALRPGTILEFNAAALPPALWPAMADHFGTHHRDQYAAWTGTHFRSEAMMSAVTNTEMSPTAAARAVIVRAVPDYPLYPHTIGESETIDGTQLWRLPDTGTRPFRGLTLREIADRHAGPGVFCDHPQHGNRPHAETRDCTDAHPAN